MITPIEKFDEAKKQNWQIEALLIGSILYALFLVPDLLLDLKNYLYDIGIPYHVGNFLILAITIVVYSTIYLFVVGLAIRLIWVIKVFKISDENVKDNELNYINKLDEASSGLFSINLNSFLLGVCTFAPWILISIIFSSYEGLSLLLFIIGIVLFYLVYAFFFIGIYFFGLSDNSSIVKYVLLIFSPIYYLVFNDKLINYQTVWHPIHAKSRKYKLLFGSIMMCAFVLPYGLSMYKILGNSNTVFPKTHNHGNLYQNSTQRNEFIIEKDIVDNDLVWIFLDQHLCKTRNQFIDKMENRVNNMNSIPSEKLSHIKVFIDGKSLSHLWDYQVIHDVSGMISYLDLKSYGIGTHEIQIDIQDQMNSFSDSLITKSFRHRIYIQR